MWMLFVQSHNFASYILTYPRTCVRTYRYTRASSSPPQTFMLTEKEVFRMREGFEHMLQGRNTDRLRFEDYFGQLVSTATLSSPSPPPPPHTHTHTRIYTCICWTFDDGSWASVMCVIVCVCMCVCMYVCVYVCVHIYVYLNSSIGLADIIME